MLRIIISFAKVIQWPRRVDNFKLLLVHVLPFGFRIKIRLLWSLILILVLEVGLEPTKREAREIYSLLSLPLDDSSVFNIIYYLFYKSNLFTKILLYDTIILRRDSSVVEHFHGKEGVPSSSLGRGSTKNPPKGIILFGLS